MSKRFILPGTLLMLGLLAGIGLGDDVDQGPVASLGDLRYLKPHELCDLYRHARPGICPLGYMRGEVLYLDNTLLPRVKAGLALAVWRGKHFGDHCFINQWTGFRAIDSQPHLGPSLIDGKPSMILEYPTDTPFFGKMRDEVRQVGPTVYLAMVYEKTVPPTFRGIIGMEWQLPKAK